MERVNTFDKNTKSTTFLVKLGEEIIWMKIIGIICKFNEPKYYYIVLFTNVFVPHSQNK